MRFGQRIGALEFDGILRGENGEMIGQGIARAVNGDLALFHRFKQGGLRARRGAIDFVHEKQVGENGAAMQRERTRGHLEDVGAHDVGGHRDRPCTARAGSRDRKCAPAF